MRKAFLWLLLITSVGCQQRSDKAFESCLPKGWDIDGPFCEDPFFRDSNGFRKKTTLREKFKELGAYCRGNQIYDRNGKKIRVFKMYEWHDVPWVGQEARSYEEEKGRKNKQELDELRRKYTVITSWSLTDPS